VRDFIGLAAEQIRRELLDLARRYKGVRFVRAPGGTDTPPPEPAAPEPDPAELERWCALHEAVAQLPAEEREVVGLAFYHGWTQARIAELFGVDERTIRRWWRSACQRLNAMLGSDLPTP
jgi:RNA polymerase sigma-70 factor (ECF subfamily)